MECIVCMEKKKNVYHCSASAEHTLCQDCEVNWRLTMPLSKSGFTLTCPMCRTPETDQRTLKSWLCEIFMLRIVSTTQISHHKHYLLNELSKIKNRTLSPELRASLDREKAICLETLYPAVASEKARAAREAIRVRVDARRRDTRTEREERANRVRQAAQTQRLARIQRLTLS